MTGLFAWISLFCLGFILFTLLKHSKGNFDHPSRRRPGTGDIVKQIKFFSSAVPSGSGAFLVPSCPSSVRPSVCPSFCPSVRQD